jgi:hypothetical protein
MARGPKKHMKRLKCVPTAVTARERTQGMAANSGQNPDGGAIGAGARLVH